jgi:GR25 family glycosyltransferase involved in LPS biosynthesis
MKEIFKKIYIINLKERSDRWDQIYNHLINIGLTEFERVEATRLNFDSTLPQRVLSRISVCHSHIKTYRKIKEDYTLVLEDDCEFFDNMYEILNKKNVRDFIYSNSWEILLFGANKRIYSKNDTVVYHTDVTQINENIYQMKECGTAHAILYKKSYIDKVLNLFPTDEEFFRKAFTLEDKFYIWDAFMSHFTKELNTKIYCIYPIIAGQRASISSVAGCYVNYNKELQNSWIEKYPLELPNH